MDRRLLLVPDEAMRRQIRQGAAISSPPKDVEADIHRLLGRFRQTDLNSLLDYVYETYPAYTVNSEKRKLASRPKTQCAVYTAGYEGLSVDGFLNLFVERDCECVASLRIAGDLRIGVVRMGREIGKTPVVRLGVPDVSQPLGKKCRHVHIPAASGCKDLGVTHPPEGFVPLRAVGRHTEHIPPLPPEDIPIELVEHRTGTLERAGLRKGGTDDLPF